MPSWAELVKQFEGIPADDAKLGWLDSELTRWLAQISKLRGDRNVILYASAFLQKPTLNPVLTYLTHEDINGIMAVMPNMDWGKNLTLILHTPGGHPGGANAIVAYLQSKFANIESVVPMYAMSAGTMVCLGTDHIVMGKQSQLGPIDAQMQTKAGASSAGAVLDTFERAKSEIQANVNLAHLWAPILAAMGPSLIQESQNALDYGEIMVKGWLQQRMFAGNPNAGSLADAVAKHFNSAQVHKSHARRIDRDEARAQKLNVEDLEKEQKLQDAVLTAYHLFSLNFSVTKALKIVADHRGNIWRRNELN